MRIVAIRSRLHSPCAGPVADFSSPVLGPTDTCTWDGPAAGREKIGATRRAGPSNSRDGPRRLVCKHFLQNVSDVTDSLRRQTTEAFHQSFRIDRPKLIQRHKTRLLVEPAWNPPGVRPAARRHWCHDRRAKVLIELVRRHDNARTGLPDLTAECGIQSYQVHVTT
jgi:hypothetical protein